MTYDKALAFYAAVFAADAGTDALYHDRYTEDMARLCIAVAEEAINRGATQPKRRANAFTHSRLSKQPPTR